MNSHSTTLQLIFRRPGGGGDGGGGDDGSSGAGGGVRGSAVEVVRVVLL